MLKTLCLKKARALLLLGLLALSAQCFALESRKPEWAIPVAVEQNLYRVTPNFYRSAKLKPESVSLLKLLGIRTVVSLRAFHSDKPVLAHSGIRMVRIPINTWDISDREVAQALRAIRDAESQGPVLLHCLHGADRTGLVTAMYRILYQGWSREQALDELQNGGYGYHALWQNIPKYLERVDPEHIRELVDNDEALISTR